MNGWLIDKSALWKLNLSTDLPLWFERINRGLGWTCLATRLEIAVSARDAQDWPGLRRRLLAPLVDAGSTPRSEAIAMEMMEALIKNRLHRAVPLPDIMIASIAAAENLTVLHDDRDFERIHEVYGRPAVERLALRPA